MKIDRSKYEEAYKCGREVHARRMRITDAKTHLKSVGINPNSAADLVYNVGRLLDGRRYTRALSVPVADDFLKWIHRDYGDRALRNAVSALRQHIEYYQSLTDSAMLGQLAVLAKYRELITTEDALIIYPDEGEPVNEVLNEGRPKSILLNIYERNVKARTLCIKNFGAVCAVCEFDFEHRYGAIGRGFIHVHHLKDIATIGQEYQVDPLRDLRPVCPNCHAMLHKSRPSYRIEELKEILKANQNRHALSKALT